MKKNSYSLYCIEIWLEPETNLISNILEHEVYDAHCFNEVIKQSSADIIATSSYCILSREHRKAISDLVSDPELKFIHIGTTTESVFKKELYSHLIEFSETSEEQNESLIDFITRAKNSKFKNKTQGDKNPGKPNPSRTLFFAPFGAWTVHHQVDAVLATSLRLRGHEAGIIACDGLFEKYCYITLHSQDRCAACKGCSETSKAFFGAFQLPVAQLREYIAESEIQNIRKWAEDLTELDLREVKYEGLPVGKIAAPTTSSYFRLPPRGLTREEVRPVFKQYIGDVVIAYKGMSRAIKMLKPSHLVIYNGATYLYAAARWAAERNNIPWVSHERGVVEGSFSFFDNQIGGNCVPFSYIADQWKNVPLTKPELEEITQYYIDREFGRRANLKTFYDFVSDHTTVRKSLAIPEDAKVVGFFTSSEHELGYWDGNKKLEKQIELISSLIEIFRDRKEYLVIRHHPNIGGGGSIRPDVYFLERAYQQARNLPSNVRIIMPHEKLTSYALLWHCDAVIALMTTVATEAAARGIPSAALDIGYVQKATSHMVRDLSRNSLEKLINDLLLKNGRCSIEEIAKTYRYTSAQNDKFSPRFKSFAIKNDSHFVNIGSPTDIERNGDPNLDRVINYLTGDSPLYPHPNMSDLDRSEAEERPYLESLLNTHNEYREKVRNESKNSPYHYNQITVACIQCQEESASALAWVKFQRHKVIELSSCSDERDFTSWLKSLVYKIAATKSDYVMIAPKNNWYDESYLSRSTHLLQENCERKAVLWGGWLTDEAGGITTGIFSKHNPVTALSQINDLLGRETKFIDLLGFMVWRKEVLHKFIELIIDGDERSACQSLMDFIDQSDVYRGDVPALVFNSKQAVTRETVIKEVEETIGLLQIERNREALVILKRVIPLMPEMPELLYAQAVAFVKVGQINEAKTTLGELLLKIPNHIEGKELLTQINQ